jgi:hypothetical protein
MAMRGDYDVETLMSTDTDLKPALEFVAGLTSANGSIAEVAAWSSAGQHNRRLAVRARNLYYHWMGDDVYAKIAVTLTRGCPTESSRPNRRCGRFGVPRGITAPYCELGHRCHGVPGRRVCCW